jgi:hypothetical protein
LVDSGANALLIDLEADRVLRAVLVGMLRETERSGPSQEPNWESPRRTASCVANRAVRWVQSDTR